jgi:glycosyltransferase involved in cell wall biosynthesis
MTGPRVPPSLSVIIPSLNGVDGVRRCLRALEHQTIRPDLEIIVVDDGSTDRTGDVAAAHHAIVIRHSTNRGVSAARNSGIRVASAPVVAFLDDDCEPYPAWAETLLADYADGVVGIGGLIIPAPGPGFVLGYLARHNPLGPQEIELASSTNVLYRFCLYLQRQWTATARVGRRPVMSFPSANMSVRRSALLAIGGFDERILFGSEDEDLCRRLMDEYPGTDLEFDPEAQVLHHFRPSLRAMMRRRCAYGRGSAIMYHKWPDTWPTVFPFPLVVLAMLCSSFWFPELLGVALLIPHGFYPRGLRSAVKERNLALLLDAYLQLAEEAADNVGFIEGLWSYRHLRSEHLTVRRAQAKPEQ